MAAKVASPHLTGAPDDKSSVPVFPHHFAPSLSVAPSGLLTQSAYAQLGFPSINGFSIQSGPSMASGLPVNQPGVVLDPPFAEPDEATLHMQPSYPYDSHRQQTGIPGGSLSPPGSPAAAALMPPNNDVGMNMGYPNSMDLSMGFSHMPAHFGTPPLTHINPRSLFVQPGTAYQKAYPGMHQEAAKQAEEQMKQREQEQAQAQAQAQMEQRRQEEQMHQQQQQQHQQQQHQQQQHQQQQHQQQQHAPMPLHDNDRVTHYLATVRQTAAMRARRQRLPESHPMPHIAKSKKAMEEMDDDEKLLASEEGRTLSMAKRRQLRNKVSARAFRARRKEYISELEKGIEATIAENKKLVLKNMEQRMEIASLQDFVQAVLTHKGFQPFLEDFVAAEQEKLAMKVNAPQAVPAGSQRAMPQPTGLPMYNGPLPTPQMPNVQMTHSPMPTPQLAHVQMTHSPMPTPQLAHPPMVNSQMANPGLAGSQFTSASFVSTPAMLPSQTIVSSPAQPYPPQATAMDTDFDFNNPNHMLPMVPNIDPVGLVDPSTFDFTILDVPDRFV